MLAGCSRRYLASSKSWCVKGAVRRRVDTRGMGLVTRGWEKKRFYEKATVHLAEDGGYRVKLDHRNLRTPLRKMFEVPSRPLALAVAEEWEVQETFVQPALMHLTALCNTVIDDPHHQTREEATEILLQFLTSDTLCFLASEPDDLVELQKREWSPVVQWFNSRFSTSIQPSYTLLPPSFDSFSLEAVRQYVHRLDQWSFTGFVYCVESCKSVILSCAVLEGRITSDEACDLALLESRHQTAQWGKVEWQHDVEMQDLRSRLAAALLLARLVNPSTACTPHIQ